MGLRHRLLLGFTIIELLLVVIILLVVVGLTVPSFSPAYARLQLHKTVEDLAFVMRYAQSRCVMNNRRIRLAFDSTLSEYQLMQQTPPSGEGEGAFEPVGGRWGRVFRIPDDVTVHTDDPFVYFFPDGRIEKQDISICRQEKCLTISTQGQRGHVWILENKG
ncbi:MAG: hypothetical protein A3G91_04605 [Omnitrophica WOR_2 bacterium RIFCSPLOWO2_12_FULL_50_9]|nr:MAG: hypothetical protein A3D87_03855 [Omnitrophica WOR_2 bacterium RIFCSPHIGHO2_02_FULL_50_17]OGX40836.1 MAG: hypothetical protein A3G91_04605 [Omnitrophica WOR_2 bacterium RIFCSPLOWO2_12_FULL_50_9]